MNYIQKLPLFAHQWICRPKNYDLFLALQKCQPETDFIDPLMSKKPRISHLSNRGPPSSSGRHSSETEDKNPHPRPLAQDPLFTLPLSRAPVQTPPVRRRAGGLRTCPWTRALYVGTPRRATPPAATRPAHPASQFPPRPPCPFPPVPSPQPPLPPPLPPAAATAFLLPRLLQPAVMAMAAKSPRSPRSTKIKRGSEKESKRGIRIRTERGIESITGRITAIRKHSPGRNIGMRQNKNTFLPTSATNRTEKVCFAMSYAFCGVNIYWIIDYYK